MQEALWQENLQTPQDPLTPSTDFN